MKYLISNTMPILLASFMLVSCTNGERKVEKQVVAETKQVDSTVPTRHCYRNEYPFDNEPDLKDVEVLNIEIVGDHAQGEYNWLPAFKDKRVGRFEGSFDGQSITARYEYTQEGQSATAIISITLEPDQVVVEAEKPELGLNSTIARVDC